VRLLKTLQILPLLGLVTLCANKATATGVPIANPSFESPALANGAFQAGAPTGWTIANSATAVVTWNIGTPYPNLYFDQAPPDGNQVLVLGSNFSQGEIIQYFNATLQPNTTYTLTYWVGTRKDIAAGEYDMQLQAGGDSLAADHLAKPPAGAWVQRTLVFNSGAQSGGQLSIHVIGTGRNYGDGIPGQAMIDNIQLDAGAGVLSLSCPASSALVNTPYSSSLAGSGGKTPYTYSIQGGNLGNLQLNTITGAITGTPLASNVLNFTAQVQDSTSTTASASCSIAVGNLGTSEPRDGAASRPGHRPKRRARCW